MYKYINLKDLRPRLPSVVKKIGEGLDRYIVAKHGRPVVVMLGMDDYESLIETLNERADKEGLKRLRKALTEARSGRTVDWASVKRALKLSATSDV